MTNYNFKNCINNFNAQAQCILSLKISNFENNDFKEVIALKNQIIANKINHNDFNFTNANLLNFELYDMTINGDLNLDNSVILGDVILKGCEINGEVNLDYAKIGGEVLIVEESKIKKIHMYRICINDRVLINHSTIGSFFADGYYKNYNFTFYQNRWNRLFSRIKNYILSVFNKDFNALKEEYMVKNGFDIVSSKVGLISVDRLNIGTPNRNGILMELVNISTNVSFSSCDIKGDVWFRRVTVDWDCDFNYSRIKSGFNFELSEIKGKLNFHKTMFNSPYAQENASREAKRLWDKLGDKERTDKYYYKEMEAKRKQKNSNYKIVRGLEWIFIQIPFGYGVKPYRVIVVFIFVISFFAFLFWHGAGIENSKSFLSNLYFSTITALKPGYSDYQPINGTYQLLASAEAIIGTFLWAIFITTFARKFMR